MLPGIASPCHSSTWRHSPTLVDDHEVTDHLDDRLCDCLSAPEGPVRLEAQDHHQQVDTRPLRQRRDGNTVSSGVQAETFAQLIADRFVKLFPRQKVTPDLGPRIPRPCAMRARRSSRPRRVVASKATLASRDLRRPSSTRGSAIVAWGVGVGLRFYRIEGDLSGDPGRSERPGVAHRVRPRRGTAGRNSRTSFERRAPQCPESAARGCSGTPSSPWTAVPHVPVRRCRAQVVVRQPALMNLRARKALIDPDHPGPPVTPLALAM